MRGVLQLANPIEKKEDHYQLIIGVGLRTINVIGSYLGMVSWREGRVGRRKTESMINISHGKTGHVFSPYGKVPLGGKSYPTSIFPNSHPPFLVV